MQPKFLHLPEIKVVGLGTKFISIMSPETPAANPIPSLWGQFVPQMDAVPHRIGHTCYGVVEMLPASKASHKDELFYIACVEVSEIGSLPSGMIHRTIPAGRYASFTHKGSLANIDQTMKSIYASWLPNSGTKLRNAPHLELYDHRFDPHSDQSEFDILLPVP